jgi:uncharacterized protein YcfJ
MRAFLAGVLSVIAVGVVMIAYGLLAARAPAAPSVVYDAGSGTYQLALPITAGQRMALPVNSSVPVYESASYAYPMAATAAPASRFVGAPRFTRPVTRREPPRRDWKKAALVIGGSAAAGAGLGGLIGGGKGALVGTAIGGGASALWQALK